MIWVRVYGGRGRSKQRLHLTLKLAGLTHTHTHTNEIVCLMKKYIFKTRSYFRKCSYICIINDLSYHPATHLQIIRMHFFITRPADYPQHPRI